MPGPRAYSVIVCTCNRAGMLALCLRALLADVACCIETGEILIVDNASIDRTRQVVDEMSSFECGRAELTYVFEPVPGLARARNRGLDESSGAIVAFLDDDALVRPGWLQNCLDAFKAWPEAVAVGGEILPSSPAQFPDWFRPPLTKVYSVMSLDGTLDSGPRAPGWLRSDAAVPSPGIRPYPGEEHPLGANMAFRRQALQDRRFSLWLGRTGGDLMGSEEAEIFFALRHAGGIILYVPDMRVDHEIAPERLSSQWAVRRYWFDGVCRARLRLGWMRWSRDAALMVAKLMWLGITGPLPRTPFNRLLWKCRTAKSLGFLVEASRGTARRILRSGQRPAAVTAGFPAGDDAGARP